MSSSTETLRRTRFVLISDTHNHTPALPRGDVLIHAGDLTNQGSYSEVRWPLFEGMSLYLQNHLSVSGRRRRYLQQRYSCSTWPYADN
ncbi:ser/Thr protein phosphatase family protein [Verticillium alfalfae VaMs.102]|uniref:Ser/Thr protein phosphatase family protein n=1 Tax=Verticillium alfalfae (strain VaMs.102 / ATCC MYA-4576 / FGSC 10136) TaxID=526221 RepID=C9SX93_VERA1|nr:ser/Thr protein phosphatase family protein [Verticillium alfalfae VaMs.102]EEY23283.1 ser/Thr protein phosphatase family protein [Verticillium alfalfae VaMs.102]